jgi:hypothetical protein
LFDATGTVADLDASIFSKFPTTVLPFIQDLSIILRLPLADFRSGDVPGNSLSTTASNLRKACSAIFGLKRLRSLRLWLDHDKETSWSLVGEREFLAPMEALARESDVRIVVNLPKLHALHEDLEKHYMEDCAPPPFTIERRVRQRVHGFYSSSRGRSHAQHKSDFPILSYNSDDSDEDETARGERERLMWKRGEDVEKLVRA